MKSHRCLYLFLLFVLQHPLFSNVLTNAGLESWSDGKPTNWEVVGVTSVEEETTTRHGGYSSAKLTAKTSDVQINQEVSVVPEHVYTFSVWVLDNTIDGQVGLTISWYDEDGYIGYRSSSKSVNSSSWQKLTILDKIAPYNAVSAILRVKVSKENNTGGAVYADDAEFIGDGSLPVTVSSFQAEYCNECVELSWSTESEEDVQAFQILRSSAASGPFYMLTSMIPQYGQIEGLGGSYRYQDFNVTAGQGYWYQLEEIFSIGNSNQYGPVFISDEANSETDMGCLSQSI